MGLLLRREINLGKWTAMREGRITKNLPWPDAFMLNYVQSNGAGANPGLSVQLNTQEEKKLPE